MEGPHLGRIAFEQRQHQLDPRAGGEEPVAQRFGRRAVLGLVDQVEVAQVVGVAVAARSAGGGRRGGGRPRRQLGLDLGLQGLEAGGQDLDPALAGRHVAQPRHQRRLPRVLDLGAGAQPDQPGEAGIRLAAQGGERAFDLGDRGGFGFGHGAVVGADQVHRKPGPGQGLGGLPAQLGAEPRQRPLGQHLEAELLQGAQQLLPLGREVGGAFGEVDRRRRGGRRRRLEQLLDQLADVLGQVVDLLQVFGIRLGRIEHLQLVDPPGGRILAEEVVTEQPLQRSRLLVERHRRLDHLEDARALTASDAAGALGRGAEMVELAAAPLGVLVARADQRHQHRGAEKAVVDHPGEDLVALDLAAVPPHLRLAAQQLAEPHPQRFLEARHPSGLPGDQRQVVAVGVAQEKVLLGLLGHSARSR